MKIEKLNVSHYANPGHDAVPYEKINQLIDVVNALTPQGDNDYQLNKKTKTSGEAWHAGGSENLKPAGAGGTYIKEIHSSSSPVPQVEYTCHGETGESGNCKHTEKPRLDELGNDYDRGMEQFFPEKSEIDIEMLLNQYADLKTNSMAFAVAGAPTAMKIAKENMNKIVDIIKQAIK